MNKQQAKWLRERLIYNPLRALEGGLWFFFVALPAAVVIKTFLFVEKLQGKKPSK